ncbi:MAG TPA: HAD hydrolase family protein [Nitrospiria bacterium]|nr:HAD hydrolase family protein [Nitrospiria bacterium]
MSAWSRGLSAKANAVSFLFLDVDGVLTDGLVTFTSEGHEIQSFHIHDGHGIKQLTRAGIDVGILSGRRSPIVDRRAKELGLVEVHQGAEDKLLVYEAFLARHGLSDRQIAYMGDDVPDVPILKRVGLALSVRNAHDAAKRSADYVTTRRGGEGAVREVCDLLLRARGIRLP